MADRDTLARLLAAPERASADQLYGVALDALDHGLEAEIVAALGPRLAGGGAGDYRLWQVLGLAERQRLNSAEAEAAFARAHALAPGNALIAHSLARSRLEGGRPDVAAFDAALALAPGDMGIVQGRMLAMLAGGEGPRALAELGALLGTRRDWFDGHLLWAKLAAIVTPGGDRYAPLRRALARYPADPQLHWVALWLALLLKDWAVARDWLGPARAAIGARPELTRIEAIVLSETGDLAGAEARFASLPPPASAEELPGPISNLIRQGRLEEAARLAETRFDGPQDIQLWPFRSLLWHALGDPRWEWLEGDERLIATYDLSVEIGDLDALIACLHRLHDAAGAPVGQSVRQGGQTDGHLFARNEPEIRTLRAAIDRAVAQHCARLQPPVAGHPTRIA
ncbi:MAG: hypothetical protein JSS36_10515, partial [Proteobacteria bacterium]|nr:hypothetical protein [Pseudomonadota bacterium]